MNKRFIYILIFITSTNLVFSQQGEIYKNETSHMNQTILDELVKPVKLELEKTTLLDGRDDSWWNTPEYWKERDLDGVRSIIFYTISDSTKVIDAIQLMLEQDAKAFNYHNEVSSLLVKVAHQFPSHCLKLLDELLKDYEPGMKLFDPYGDVIYRCLFKRLNEGEKEKLQKNLIDLLRKEEFEFINWAPILKVLLRNGDTKYLKEVIKDNEHRFKPIDSKGYYSVVIQAKAKAFGIEIYPELRNIINKNPNNVNRLKYALYAMQAIAKNHKLSQLQIDQFYSDINNRIILDELDDIKSQTIILLGTNE